MRVALVLAVFLMLQVACARDEGEYLGQQIADAAQQLAASNDDELIFRYTPRSGANQKYWVAIGAGKICPDPPCAWSGKSWLIVHTQGRDSGSDFYYQRFVTVPRPLRISKDHAPVEVVLRKIGDEIQLVDLR